VSASSYAQFIYFRYARFSSLRPKRDLLAAPPAVFCLLFLLFLFMCVSEPASVQMRLFYEEHLILFAALIN
jgi:hypothetical protein